MKQMKKILTVFLVMCLALCMCACGAESGETNESVNNSAESSAAESAAESKAESEAESEPETASAFKVNVVDESGNPVANVMLQVCKDTCIPAKTGEDGVASFNVEITDGYKLSVLSCPSGYEYTGDAEVYLESGATEITIELNKGN